MRADHRTIGRRGFLALTAGAAAAGLAACGNSPSGPAPARIGPRSPQVAAVEQRRRGAGVSTTSVSLQTTDGGVDLSNTLQAPTTIHWHGIALRNDMDGVPVLTQAEIEAGDRFTYEFAVPDAGTYWFHPHVGTQLDTWSTRTCWPMAARRPRRGRSRRSPVSVSGCDWSTPARTPRSVSVFPMCG